jgi:hypothetical protein
VARPGLHIFLQNWRNSDASLREKLREAIANQAIKARTHSTCCGHPGQPGC